MASNQTKKDFMYVAEVEALYGITYRHGGPFGAVVVKDGEIVGSGHNTVLRDKDPTCHGEMNAIRDACKNLGTFDLSGCELYTTGYNCPMCLCATRWANIKKIYYGCTLEDNENIGFRDVEFTKALDDIDVEQVDHRGCRAIFDAYMKTDPQNY